MSLARKIQFFLQGELSNHFHDCKNVFIEVSCGWSQQTDTTTTALCVEGRHTRVQGHKHGTTNVGPALLSCVGGEVRNMRVCCTPPCLLLAGPFHE